MTYRPPSATPRGRWAVFLHQQRREHNWSQQQAFEELHEGLGLGPKSRASYVALDMGERQPKAHEEAFLVSFFGREPAAADAVADEAPTLASALMALTAEMANWREERVAMRSRIAALEARLGLDADADPELAAWGQAHSGSPSRRPVGHPAT